MSSSDEKPSSSDREAFYRPCHVHDAYIGGSGLDLTDSNGAEEMLKKKKHRKHKEHRKHKHKKHRKHKHRHHDDESSPRYASCIVIIFICYICFMPKTSIIKENIFSVLIFHQREM